MLIISAHANICRVEKVESGGTKSWVDIPETACWYPGTTCKEINCPSLLNNTIEITPSSMGGWVLRVQFAEGTIDFETVGVTPYSTMSRSAIGYTFTGNEANLKIISSDDYPQLNGISISLNNVTIDPDRYVSVFIPPIQ